MTAPTLSFSVQTQTIGGTGSRLDTMDAIYTLFATKTTKWEVKNSVGTTGAYEVFNIGPKSGSALPDQRVCIGNTTSATVTMQSPDTFTTSVFLVGHAPAGGTFDGAAWADGTPPYGSAAFCGFSKWAPSVTTGAELVVYESDECFSLYLRTTANAFYGFSIGAIWACDATNSSESGRVYGYFASGTSTIVTNFNETTGQYADHAVSNNNPHCYAFRPNSSTVDTVRRSYIMRNGAVDTTLGGDNIYRPLHHETYTSNNPIGVLRETYMCYKQWKCTVTPSGSSTIAYFGFAPSTSANVCGFLYKA